MIIRTNKGVRIDCEKRPEWSAFHKQFYVIGRRWIKSKKHFSSSMVVHSFPSFEVEKPEWRPATECLKCGDPTRYPDCMCGTEHALGGLASDLHP